MACSFAFIYEMLRIVFLIQIVPSFIRTPEFDEAIWPAVFVLAYEDSFDLGVAFNRAGRVSDGNCRKGWASWLDEFIPNKRKLLIVIGAYFLSAVIDLVILLSSIAHMSCGAAARRFFLCLLCFLESLIESIITMNFIIFFEHQLTGPICFTTILCLTWEILAAYPLYFLCNSIFIWLIFHFFDQTWVTMWINVVVYELLICSIYISFCLGWHQKVEVLLSDHVILDLNSKNPMFFD